MQVANESMRVEMSQEVKTYGHLPDMTIGKPLTVGQRIRQAREAIGMGQNEMAKAVGVEGVTAYRWESGRATPPLDRLSQIASVLKVSMAELLPDDYDDAQADEQDNVVPLDDRPDELVHLAELALAAARGGIEAKLALNNAVKERARRLRAAERAEKARED